jgi:hypothetical protein
MKLAKDASFRFTPITDQRYATLLTLRTSDGNASPGLRVRDLAPETGQGQSHCRRKLNG